ncbi:uncharacterized protein MONOS_14479 [Monocercomonoides exilis]|uniref:uncharacterized protein n=1 Tax=Monocercomonoides exilis TaxID=2049356 RepID=UPI003559E06D|nr:hypothetical protein MONOS_14479 [Monocercomonoides exilis]|eukprot:MONOS_14479.1-p1 / transcript=MONOS_14479.1 / gene=MONOS_14479 / organism=Monocercomonoides_exilis_PA203 / gene_product=unspecified product / transcript_product=unspecified product / location=Mono_scaffold01009:15102-16461(+) / protein_length=324 / sequence_SO=supercontig / SO=protein_coding / is_pseudo=false
MSFINLTVKQIDARQLSIPESVSDKLLFSISIGSNTVHSSTQGTSKIYKFPPTANFGLLPDSTGSIEIELFNAKKKPHVSLGSLSLDASILSEKQEISQLEIPGLLGTFNIVFLLGHELQPNSIMKSERLDVWSGVVVKSFTPTWVILGAANLLCFKDETVVAQEKMIELKGITLQREPEEKFKKQNVLSLLPPQPSGGASEKESQKGIASFFGKNSGPEPIHIRFETESKMNEWMDAIQKIQKSQYEVVLCGSGPSLAAEKVTDTNTTTSSATPSNETEEEASSSTSSSSVPSSSTPPPPPFEPEGVKEAGSKDAQENLSECQ